jgi:predicted dehydrogenase
VLCEKPLARTPEEAAALVAVAAQSKRALKTGFNHRYHPAIAEAHRLACEGRIGRILVLRCRYGHGGRTGYEHEWRADRVSGGGELLDQGVHALDLFRWFAGEFTEMSAMVSSAYWPIEVEDNAFCLLRTAEGATASLHASWTQWKNLFSFEVFGESGYLEIEGLGGSYGPERLVIGERRASGAPSEQQIEFLGEDTSWAAEWAEFTAAIREERAPEASGWDGWQALRLAAAAYESARSKTVVRIENPKQGSTDD